MDNLSRKLFLKMLVLIAGGGLVSAGGLSGCGGAPAAPGGGDPDSGGSDGGLEDGGVTEDDAGTPDADGGTHAGTDAGHDAGHDAGVPNHCPNGAKHSSITANTGHALSVPPEDVAAGVEKTYSIKGSSGHSHSITITAAQFEILRGGGSFSVRSTTTLLHSHNVTVACH